MTLELPKAVAAYFAADEQDGEAVARCFTESASCTSASASSVRPSTSRTCASIPFAAAVFG